MTTVTRKKGLLCGACVSWAEVTIPKEAARGDMTAALLVIEVTEAAAEAAAAAETRIVTASVLTATAIIATATVVRLVEAEMTHVAAGTMTGMRWSAALATENSRSL